MHELIKTNVKRACVRVNDFPLFEFEPNGFSGHPVFDGDPLRCLQHEFFGFYVLPFSAASLFRSVNFLTAAESALRHKLYAPSVAMAYSAAYHLLGTFLAMNGRLWLDRPWFRHEDEERGEGWSRTSSARLGLKPILAVLTKENRWTYEKRSQSHKGRWLDLANIFNSRKYPLPDSFQELFSYMFQGRHKRCDDLVDFVNHPDKYHYEIREVLEEFLGEIPSVRHISLYAGFGGDPHVLDALTNRETFDARLLDLRAQAFVGFAFGFAAEVGRDLDNLFKSSCLSPSLADKVGIRLHCPIPLDKPRLDLLPHTPTRQHCEKLWNLLTLKHGDSG